jgi:HD-GYP domain-containing protein (c-di-GMP phosphodiesterase class II)
MRRGRLVYKRPARRRFDLKLAAEGLVSIQSRLPAVETLRAWLSDRMHRLATGRSRAVFRVAAVALWAVATLRLLSTTAGPGLQVSHVSIWAIAGAGYLLGVVFWALPWIRPSLRLPMDHILGAIIIGIVLPLLVLSFTGNLRGRDPSWLYVAAAVFTAALLPLRTAIAVAVLGAAAATIPLLFGWSAYYGRSLLVLVSVIGLLMYTQARMVGNMGLRKREAEDRQQQIEDSFMATIGALATSTFAKDRSQEAHSRGTANLAVVVGRRMGLKGQRLRHLEFAALLHDVGKAGIPGAVLSKPGPLSTNELDLVHEHPIIAERILARVPALKPICPIIRGQYERWNGGGYPDGLIGEAIPLGARILHACAAFHAMSTDRPYRPALPEEAVVRELRVQGSKQFDPRVVEALIDVLDRGEVEMADLRTAADDVRTAQESREWLQQLQTIEGLGASLGQETGVEQVCRLTGEVAASLLVHDQIRIYLVDRQTKSLVTAYLSPATREEFSALTPESVSLSAASGIAGQTLQKRRGLIVGDAEPGEVGLPADPTGAVKVSAVTAPVLYRDEPLAVIEVVRLGSRQYERNHIRLLRVLAGQMALSVTNARLVERLAA